MAWIVKDAAHEQIDRRQEPYLTEQIKQKLEEVYIPRYATRHAALLPTLHTLQHTYGWLPYQALEEAADFLEISHAEAVDTATFYEEFQLKPIGQHLIQVCRSISCELCGYQDLSRQVQEKLDILPGETTEDGKFTLVELECLGSCGTAPVTMINEELHENVTWEQLEKQIDQLAR